MTMLKNQIDRLEPITIRFLGDNMTLTRNQWVELIDLMVDGPEKTRLMERIINEIPEDVLADAFADGVEAANETAAGGASIEEATRAGDKAACAVVKLPVGWAPYIFHGEGN